jgi:hypothetical protein
MKISAANKSCVKCKFFVPDTFRYYDEPEAGECRRFPPVASVNTYRGHRDYGATQVGDIETFFRGPKVEKNYWCGEFKRKPSA